MVHLRKPAKQRRNQTRIMRSSLPWLPRTVDPPGRAPRQPGIISVICGRRRARGLPYCAPSSELLALQVLLRNSSRHPQQLDLGENKLIVGDRRLRDSRACALRLRAGRLGEKRLCRQDTDQRRASRARSPGRRRGSGILPDGHAATARIGRMARCCAVQDSVRGRSGMRLASLRLGRERAFEDDGLA